MRRSVSVAVAVALGLGTGVVSVASQPRPDDAPPATFAALMSRLAAVPGLTASFREQKRIALLAAPLVSEGTIAFSRPGRLLRRTVRPEASTVIVDGQRLRVADASGRHEIDLRTGTALGTLVASFVRLLAGDRAALERSFFVQYTTSGAGWSVVMRPRAAAVAAFVRQIRADGRGAEIARLLVVDGHGDESDTAFSQVNATRRFTSAELGRMFGPAR